jgi:hypothetical protein
MRTFPSLARLFLAMLCLSFTAFHVMLRSQANAADTEQPKAQKRIAVIVFSPGLGEWDRITVTPRATWEIGYLGFIGYDVYIMRGSVDNILLALLEPQVKAISYFGHAAFPSIENLDAGSWKSKVFQKLQEQYIKQGLSAEEAYKKADAQSQNFGLELVRNHSCGSLMTTDLAHQFVKPGGEYHGVKTEKYTPWCLDPKLLLKDVSFDLDVYEVPKVLPVKEKPEGEGGRSYTAQPRRSYTSQPRQ